VFFAVTVPHVKVANLVTTPLLPFGWKGVVASVPSAIWFYLAIEGVAMSAEETANPQRDIPKGYISGILTLVALSLGTLVAATGVMSWQQLGAKDNNNPLPMAMAAVLTKDHPLTHMLVGIGLFGLIASFHGIIMGYSRQTFALARARYLPRFLARIHPRFQTPHWATLIPGLIGAAAVLTNLADQIIVVSVLGAIVLYLVSMAALFALRRREPDLKRPFRAPWYPFAPALAFVLALGCLVAVVWFNPAAARLAGGIFLAGIAYYFAVARTEVLAHHDLLSFDEIESAHDAGVPAPALAEGT
jgi:ethanolamine permease